MMTIFCSKEFCNSFSSGLLIKTPTSYIGYIGTKSSSIDLKITNMTSLFMKPCNLEMGLSDQHKPLLFNSLLSAVCAHLKLKTKLMRIYNYISSF